MATAIAWDQKNDNPWSHLPHIWLQLVSMIEHKPIPRPALEERLRDVYDHLDVTVAQPPTGQSLLASPFSVTNNSRSNVIVHSVLCISNSIMTYQYIAFSPRIAVTVLQNDVLLTSGGDSQTRECLTAIARLAGGGMLTVGCADIVVDVEYSLPEDDPKKVESKFRRFAVSPINGQSNWVSQGVNDPESYCVQVPKQQK